jgi:Mg/Co/Ni transporter MgtE
MLEIIAGCASFQHPTPSTIELVAMWFLWVVCVLALVTAVITAVQRRHFSSSYSADLMLAVFSPVVYWILFAFGAVSHAVPSRAA